MARFDRYMLSQLLVLFGFFSLVLVMVYWINRAVVLFDQLIANGQSAVVFLEFTALSLPSVIKLALPLSAFAASVYVTNRMTSESEMTAVQATGFSNFRIARPVLYFGLIVMLMMSALTQYLLPLSTARLEVRSTEIAQNMTARLLTEGKFIEPADGITFYIREVTPGGELRDIFLADTRNPASQVIYTADQAYMVKTNDDVQLVMVNGAAQTLRTSDNRLFTTTFKDFTYNIGGLLHVTQREGRRAAEVYTPELLAASDALQQETGETRGDLITRAHDRFAQPLLSVVASLLGFAALMVGGFSRFGVWRQIVVAIFLIIVVKAFETVCINIASKNPALWIMVYAPSALGLLISWALLAASQRPYLFKRRHKQGATA